MDFFEADFSIVHLRNIITMRGGWPKNVNCNDWSGLMKTHPSEFNKMFEELKRNLQTLLNKTEESGKLHECLFVVLCEENNWLSNEDKFKYESIIGTFDVTLNVSFYCKLVIEFQWQRYFLQMIGQRSNAEEICKVLLNSIDLNEVSIEQYLKFVNAIRTVAVRSGLTELFRHCDLLIKKAEINFQKVLGFELFEDLLEEIIKRSINERSVFEYEPTCQLLLEEVVRDLPVNSYEELPKEILMRIYELIECANIFCIKLPAEKTAAALVKEVYTCNLDFKLLETYLNCNRKKVVEFVRDNIIIRADLFRHPQLSCLLKSCHHDQQSLALTINRISNDLICGNKSAEIFQNLLIIIIKTCIELDYKLRLDKLKLKKLADNNFCWLSQQFSRVTTDNDDSYKVFQKELAISAYLDPSETIMFVLDKIISKSGQMSLLASFLIDEFKVIVSYFVTDELTLLQDRIIELVNRETKLDRVEYILQLIQFFAERDSTFSLEKLYIAFLQDDSENWHFKLVILHGLLLLSNDDEWEEIAKHCVENYVWLEQMLDKFWKDCVLKELVVNIIDLTLQKVKRLLTPDELEYFLKRTLDMEENSTASSPVLYIAYFHSKTFINYDPKEVYEIASEVYCSHDQILHLASIMDSFNWICEVYPHYNLFLREISSALKLVLPSLTHTEWLKLYDFLIMYFYHYEVIQMFVDSLAKLNKHQNFNYMLNGLVSVIKKVAIPAMKAYFPSSEECDEVLLEQEWITLFKFVGKVGLFVFKNEHIATVKEVLIELGKELKLRNIEKNQIDPSLFNIPLLRDVRALVWEQQ